MFTLAHLSDVHLAPMPRPSLADLTPKRALGLVNWHRQRKHQHKRHVLDALTADIAARKPDHIAVGGDLVNIGLPAEIAAARAWLETLGGPDRVTAIPGNHDVYGRLREDQGIEHWRDYMRGNVAGEGFAAGPAQGLHAGFPFVRTFGAIALIGLSSAVPTPPLWASGRLGKSQRRAVAAILRMLGASGHCRIVLIHHPPLPGQAGRLRGLEDAAEFAAVLEREGAELVLHGHNHVPSLAAAKGPGGPVPVVGVPSASAQPGAHSPPARYNLIAIEPHNGRWRLQLTGREYTPSGQLRDVEQRLLAP